MASCYLFGKFSRMKDKPGMVTTVLQHYCGSPCWKSRKVRVESGRLTGKKDRKLSMSADEAIIY